jgi:hypothetical protein
MLQERVKIAALPELIGKACSMRSLLEASKD